MDMTMPGGIRVTTYHPPQGFDPLTAGNVDLQKAGFPRGPTTRVSKPAMTTC